MRRTSVLFLTGVVSLGVTLPLFAGGEAETGRDAASEQVAEGQLLPVGSIDPANYLSDFECDVENRGETPLVVAAELLQNRMWEDGGAMSLRITLVANRERYFSPTTGLFVIFFQNPELLRSDAVPAGIADLVEEHRELDVRVLDADRERLLPASSQTDFLRSADIIAGRAKSYDQNRLIQRALDVISNEGAKRSHVLWVTDEDIAERPADLTFFNFAVELFAGSNTTLSYLAYGERPNWSQVNDALMKRNGNSYYADDEEELIEKTGRDLDYFLRPAVEDVRVSINLARPITEMGAFYPRQYYGDLPQFYPNILNNRPRSIHTLGGMNYDEVKRFVHYLSIPAYLDLIDQPDPTPLLDGDVLTVGRIYVKYYLPMDDRWVHLQQDLTLEYVDSDQASAVTTDPMVRLDTIIQNTPLIMLEAARLVNNSRNYLLALKLLQAQISLLDRFGPARPDEAISEDIETLRRYYAIVFDRAKSVNLLE